MGLVGLCMEIGRIVGRINEGKLKRETGRK